MSKIANLSGSKINELAIKLSSLLASLHSSCSYILGEEQFAIAPLDLSPANTELSRIVFESTETFSKYINQKLSEADADFLIGGYGEHREIYRRSSLFDDDATKEVKEEPRNIHLGVDIWGAADTPIFAPLSGQIHSFRFNDNFGDYGATIVLKHKLEHRVFHTLFGHLALKDLENLTIGQPIAAGQQFCHFGPPQENGHWPPHLHFQVIEDMYGMEGDFPGVCKTSEKEKFLSNSPDANLLLKFI